MQRWITILAGVFVLQLLVAGALTLRKDAVTASTPSTPLLTAAFKDVDRIVIDDKSLDSKNTDDKSGSSAASVELVKQNGKWTIHNYFDAPANGAKVDELLGKLVDLKRGLPIATSTSALRRFKVGDHDYERRVTLSGNGKTLETLYFGDSSGVHKADVRTARDHAVYAVDLPIYELPAKSQDWFNTGLLQHPAQQLAELDIHGATHENLTLTHVVENQQANKQVSKQMSKQAGNQQVKQEVVQGNKQNDKQNQPAESPAASWQVQNLGAGKQLDIAHVDELVRAIDNLHVTGVLGKSANPDWQMDHPLLQLTLKDNHGQTREWTLAKSSSGDTDVLKSSAQPWYFSISTDAAKSLLDNSSNNTLIVSAHENGNETGNEKNSSDKHKTLASDAHKRSGSA